MTARIGLLAAALTTAALADVPITKVRALRKVHKLDKDHQEVFYKYEDEGEYVTPLDQARQRGAEAAKAWEEFEKSQEPVAVLARSPFGGGETAGSYWPAGVKCELLRKLIEPLTKQGLKVVLPDLPPEKKEGDDEDKEEDDEEEVKPYPKIGFSEDYEFVVVIGLHHEKIPYKGIRYKTGEQLVHRFSSRVNAWAILFHAPTGSAFWGTTSVARAGHGTVPDTLNTAAEAALMRLDLTKIGVGELSGQIKAFSERKELPRMDVAGMLVQTQRADAVAAVMKAAISKPAFRNTVWVVRHYSNRGVVQDYRTDPAQAKGRGCVEVNQRVLMRVLLMEQLRGMRTVQGCVLAAGMPLIDDIEVPEIGRKYVSTLGPVFADDEVVLITELAHNPPRHRRGMWGRDPVRAVRNLGRCKVHIDEAMAVARTFASRKLPPPRRGRRPRRDPLKEAGQAAMRELAKARAEREKKVRQELRRIKEALD